jgi:hypothetical protein
MSIIQNIFHYGDLLAIVGFIMLIIYFYNIKEKTTYEYLLFAFSIGGLIADIIFSIIYFSNINL